MVYCHACKRSFANGASLRTHRSKFHRKEPEDTETNNAKTVLEYEVESDKTAFEQSEDDTDNQGTKTDFRRKDALDSDTRCEKSTQTEDDTDITVNTYEKTKLTAKRKAKLTSTKRNANMDNLGIKKRRFNPYPSKSKERHVFKILSSINNTLETIMKNQNRLVSSMLI